MATISRTGITAGGTISPTHITNIIDALDGTGVGITVVATGSFSGSLVGNATTATSASFATTASYVANASSFPYTGSAIISGSLRVTGSLNVSGPAIIVGTTTITGSVNIDQTAGGKATTLNGTISGNASLVLDLAEVGKSPGTGQFILPTYVPGSEPSAGTMYWNDAASRLYIYKATDPAGWVAVELN